MSEAFKNLLFLSLALVFFSKPVLSEENRSYPAGSIGFLYQKCQSDLQLDSFENFKKSWCGVFLNSYKGGYSSAVWKTHGKEDPNEYVPHCLEAVNFETGFKENNFRCRSEEFGLINGLSVFRILQYFFTWVEWLEVADPDMLKKPIVPYVNLISHQGDFCDSLGDNPPTARNFKVNQSIYSDLTQVTPDVLASYNMTQKEIYTSCKSVADKTSDDFYNSLCGAYNTGFMAGIYVTDFTLDRSTNYPGCESEVQKYYEFEIAVKELCIPTDAYELFQQTFKYSSYDEKTGRIVTIKNIDLCSGEYLF